MEMVGVIWVAGPQYGREPSAARAPHRLHKQCLLGTRLMPDREAPPIGEQDSGDDAHSDGAHVLLLNKQRNPPRRRPAADMASS